MPTILVHPGAFTLEGELDRTTIERLERGLAVYDELLREGVPKEKIFFVSSVKDKRRDGKSQSALMKEVIIEKRKVAEEQIVTSDESHTTWEDVVDSYRLVKTKNLPQPVINVSSCDHVWLRVWLIASFWGKRLGIKVKFACSRRMRWKDTILEPVKLVRVFFLILITLPKKESTKISGVAT